MIEAIVFIGLYAVDLLCLAFGFSSYLLLAFPLLLYLRGATTPRLLIGTFLAGFLTEGLHGFLDGSLLIGLGLGLFLLKGFDQIVDWRHPFVKLFGLLLLFLPANGVRVLLRYYFRSELTPYSLLAWVVSWIVGGLLLELFHRFYEKRNRQSRLY